MSVPLGDTASGGHALVQVTCVVEPGALSVTFLAGEAPTPATGPPETPAGDKLGGDPHAFGIGVDHGLHVLTRLRTGGRCPPAVAWSAAWASAAFCASPLMSRNMLPFWMAVRMAATPVGSGKAVASGC